ncbi:toxin-antitoxin system YwqK family antitoxin [Fulvivirga sediminis]|nr:hypothetical protein [Fulvivirga sediminis]
MKYPFLIILLLFIGIHAKAQEVDPESTDKMFTINTPITIELDDDKEEEDDTVEPKKKKRKKKVFYGIKTKKRFTQSGSGTRKSYELFYVIKDPIELDPYVRDIYWVDYRRGAIRHGGEVDQEHGAVLHGPYKRMQGEQLIEEGIFYKGMKHGRWVEYDKNDLLVDKEKYYKGWPKESKVSYYDRNREKMKEIVPIEYGEKEGNYFYFHENGRVAVRGEFKWDQRVGDWVEYYTTGRRKKVVRYPKEPYNDDMNPYTWKEWNQRGKLVYEKR